MGKTERALLILLTLGALLAVGAGCAGELAWGGRNDWATDLPGGQESGESGTGADGFPAEGGGGADPSGLPSCFEPGAVDSGGGAAPGSGADVGEGCDETEDCRAPFVCLEGVCVAPGSVGAMCDGIEFPCPEADGTACVGGFCVLPDRGCVLNADCAAGYRCEDGRCVPAEGDCYADSECPDGRICDFGVCMDATDCAITADLRGTWSAESVLHLGEAAGGLLRAMEWIRNLMLGRGHSPDTLAIFEDIVLWAIDSYLVPWEREVILALGDISDLLDDTRVRHTNTLDAECRELYRGTISFDHVELALRGERWSARPDDIPYVGPIPPAEFGARLRCRSIAIDRFRVSHLMAGLLRWLADGITQSASRGAYSSIGDVVRSVIDCPRIASAVLGAYPTLGLGFEIACRIAVETAVDAIEEALSSPVELTLMRLAGEATVTGSDRLLDGHWFGSFGIGDFTGEFDATRSR